jgi:hypothetical protein
MENSKTPVDIKTLIQTSTIDIYDKNELINKLKHHFSEDEQRLYVSNLFLYLNYHPLNDFIINLDNVWKFIGFSNKGNAKRLLQQHFIENNHYKKLLLRTEKQLKNGKNIGGAGHNQETIMLNINTFKKLCLKANTENADKIHDYYIKLEMVYNELMKEQLDNKDKLLENKEKQLEEQQQKIEMLEHKPETEGFFRESGYIYIIKETAKFGRYKIGKSKKPIDRISSLNVSSSETSLLLDKQFETIDMDSAEKTIHLMLKPYKIKKRNEWFFFKDEIELNNAINTIIKCLEFIKQYRKDNDFIDIKNENNNKGNNIVEQETEDIISEKEKIGIYKGVMWDKRRKKWRSELVKDYKSYFLGYYNTELDGAKAYNDYASYLNINDNANYILNVINDYIPNPRNIPDDNKKLVLEKKSSKYNGVYYDNIRKTFLATMRFKRKHINLGNHDDEIECAKMYNQQAMYFNNNYSTNYILNNIENYVTIEKNIYNELKKSYMDIKSSVYVGVVKRKNGRFNSQIILNKKIIRLGIFENEIDAAKAYNEKAKEFNIKYNKNYKVNIFN